MPSTTARTSRVAAVLLALVAITLVACTSNDDATPTPTATPTATSAVASPTDTSTPDATATPDEGPPPFATVVPTIDGLTVRTDNIEGDPYRFFATYPEIGRYPLLGDTLAEAVHGIQAEFEELQGPFTASPSQVAGPSLNISFDFLVASGDVIGVHLLTYEFFGANGRESSTIFWFDLAGGGPALDGRGLLDGDAGIQAIADATRAQLLADYSDRIFPEELDRYLAADSEEFPAVAFAANGDLLLVFDEYTIGPGAIGQVAIALPPATFEAHLSDLGRRARQEVLTPSDSLALPTQTPTRSPVAATNTPDSKLDCSAVACVALTFDDGPAGHTPALLDFLDQADAPATFFVVGINAQYHPKLLVRMVEAGHEIGNHTYDHRDLTTLSAAAIGEQWSSTARIVEAATGFTPVLLRPPYGAVNATARETAPGPFVLWSVDPRDWADRNAAVVTQRVLDDTRPGSIVLLHDIHATTVAAVPDIIRGLRNRGFTLVTVTTLLGTDLVAGRSYTSR